LDFLWCKFCYRFLRNQTAVARVALFWSHFWVEMQVLKSRTDSDAILTIFSSWIYFRFLDFFVMQILAQVSSKSDCCSPSSAVQKSFLRLFWVYYKLQFFCNTVDFSKRRRGFFVDVFLGLPVKLKWFSWSLPVRLFKKTLCVFSKRRARRLLLQKNCNL
jgi:hypothetical protein